MVHIAGVKNPVDTGDTYFGEIAAQSIAGSREAKLKLQRDRINKLEVYDDKPLEAKINFARYVVDCPNCNSAEYAFEDKLFFCSLCHNSDIGSKARKVKLPPERKKIEELLSKRKIKNRHWLPGETIEDLKKENKANGIGD